MRSIFEEVNITKQKKKKKTKERISRTCNITLLIFQNNISSVFSTGRRAPKNQLLPVSDRLIKNEAGSTLFVLKSNQRNIRN